MKFLGILLIGLGVLCFWCIDNARDQNLHKAEVNFAMLHVAFITNGLWMLFS